MLLLTAKLEQDNPLHIALFSPHLSAPGAYLEFSFLLNSTLDIFDSRTRQKSNTSVDQDLGLLQAVDERLSCWGWETGTGTRFCIVVDMFGKEGAAEGQVRGLREGELKPVGDLTLHDGEFQWQLGRRRILMKDRQAFRALQTAYIHLLRNPFYTPDEHTPMAVVNGKGQGGEITSRRFIAEVKRIGEIWAPGVTKI